MDDLAIIIVGHGKKNPILPHWAKYVERESDSKLDQKLKPEDNFSSTGLAWSEYAAWFENPDLLKHFKVKGLAHYRCVLNLHSIKFKYLPVSVRYLFLKTQKRKYERISNSIVVGFRNQTETSVFDQFNSFHPESSRILIEACEIYDNLFGVHGERAITRLKTLRGYFPRSIFISDSNFYSEWLNGSYEIARNLDKLQVAFPDNRWGGFVLERLFTLFVLDFTMQKNLKLIEVEQVYFLPNFEWLKVILLKIKLIKILANSKYRFF